MSAPTELSVVPGVIPYVDNHDGARRLLTLEIPPSSYIAHLSAPIAGIDGRQYVVTWGPVSFEIPADRNVHISVHLQDTGNVQRAHKTSYPQTSYPQTQFASVVLPPDAAPVRLIARLSEAHEGVIEHCG